MRKIQEIDLPTLEKKAKENKEAYVRFSIPLVSQDKSP